MRLVATTIAIALIAASITIVRPGDLESILIVVVIALSLLPQAWDVVDFDYQAYTTENLARFEKTYANLA